MWRKDGESNLSRLDSLELDLESLIDDGGLTTFELIDAGSVPEALPPPPSSR